MKLSTKALIRKRLRDAYRAMFRRCYGNSKHHASYKKNNIQVCERWRGSQGRDRFIEDMGASYQLGLTLDRIDPFGDYSPDNCRWIPKDQQAANRTDTIWYEVNGERVCLKHAMEKMGRGGEYERVVGLINQYGMSVEDALQRPPQEYRKTTPVVYHGEEYPSLGYLIRQAGHGNRRQSIYKRIRNGHSIEDAIDTPFSSRLSA